MRWIGVAAIVAMAVPSAIACAGIIAVIRSLKLSLEATDKEFVKERKDGDSD
jgi:hypothetical protein